MKRVLFLAGIAGALVGCGGGLPTPPALPNFNYGAPSSTLSFDQSDTVDSAESGLSSASGMNGGTANPQAAPVLADQLGGNLPDPSLVAVFPSAEAALKSLPLPSAGAAASAFRSSGLTVGNSDCISQSGGSVRYSNCSYSGEGFNWTMNGTITVASGSLSWDIQATFEMNSEGISGKGQLRWVGQLSWTGTTVQGNGRSELAVRVEGQGQRAEIGMTTGWKADLQIDATNHCISGGWLEVGRAVEGNASGGESVSAATGWKFTWNGCGSVQVAVGN